MAVSDRAWHKLVATEVDNGRRRACTSRDATRVSSSWGSGLPWSSWQLEDPWKKLFSTDWNALFAGTNGYRIFLDAC